jgi:ribonuclease E
MRMVMPHELSKFKLYQDKVPLFTRYQVESQIETAFRHEVRLPSGGALVIDPTEALISIDVNSARANKGGDIEETAFNTNLEAAEEIARQLRLRDLGGLVVIDFIDMTPSRHQREVENRLREHLKVDRARVQVGRISRFGLLEMSRQRLRPSLGDAHQEVCPRCSGLGHVRGVQSLGLAVLRIIEEEANKDLISQLVIQLPVGVATFMLNEKRAQLDAIERRTEVKVLLIPNPHLDTPHYEIERIKSGNERSELSHDLLNKPAAETFEELKDKPVIEKPAVTGVSPAAPAPVVQPKEQAKPSLLKRLLGVLTGSKAESEEEEKPEVKRTANNKRSNGRGRNAGRRNQSNRRPKDDGDTVEKQQTSNKNSTDEEANDEETKPRNTRRSRRGGRRRRPRSENGENAVESNLGNKPLPEQKEVNGNAVAEPTPEVNGNVVPAAPSDEPNGNTAAKPKSRRAPRRRRPAKAKADNPNSEVEKKSTSADNGSNKTEKVPAVADAEE